MTQGRLAQLHLWESLKPWKDRGTFFFCQPTKNESYFLNETKQQRLFLFSSLSVNLVLMCFALFVLQANAVISGDTTSILKPKTHSFKPKTCHRRIKGKRFPGPVNQSASTSTVPPELVSRLPSALQEINRRLTGQNLVWWTMQLQQIQWSILRENQ